MMAIANISQTNIFFAAATQTLFMVPSTVWDSFVAIAAWDVRQNCTSREKRRRERDEAFVCPQRSNSTALRNDKRRGQEKRLQTNYPMSLFACTAGRYILAGACYSCMCFATPVSESIDRLR